MIRICHVLTALLVCIGLLRTASGFIFDYLHPEYVSSFPSYLFFTSGSLPYRCWRCRNCFSPTKKEKNEELKHLYGKGRPFICLKENARVWAAGLYRVVMGVIAWNAGFGRPWPVRDVGLRWDGGMSPYYFLGACRCLVENEADR